MAEALVSWMMTYEGGLEPLGERMKSMLQAWASEQLAFCAQPPETLRAPPLVLTYKELIADPIAAVRRVYTHAGRELSPETEASMREHLGRETQHKAGKPDYSLHKFGLNEPMVEEQFRLYRAGL